MRYPTLVILCVLVQECYAGTKEPVDPVRFSFPLLEFDERQSAPEFGKQVELVRAARQQCEAGMFGAAEYEGLKAALEEIIHSSNTAIVIADTRRQLITFQWCANLIDAKAAASQLTNLADRTEDSRQANFARGYASTILARDGELNQAATVFEAMDPKHTPQYGAFAFVINREYAMHVSGDVSREEWEKGQPIQREYQRGLEYAAFLEHVFIPRLSVYRKEAMNPTVLECVQHIDAITNTARYLREVLGGRLYMDLCERTTDVLFPLLLEEWEKSLELLLKYPELKDMHTQATEEMQKYKQEIVPAISSIRERISTNRQFGDDFAELGSILAKELDSYNVELLNPQASESPQLRTREESSRETEAPLPVSTEAKTPGNTQSGTIHQSTRVWILIIVIVSCAAIMTLYAVYKKASRGN